MMPDAPVRRSIRAWPCVAALLCCACTTRGQPTTAPPVSPDGAPAPARAPAFDAAPSFDAVSGWGVLRWGMTLGEVTRALDDAHIAYREQAGATGIFADPDRNRPFQEISFDRLTLTQDGWNVTVELRGGVLDRVELSRVASAAQAVDEAIAMLAARHGPPDRFPAGATPQARWTNRTTILEVTSTALPPDRLVVRQTWQPSTRP